MNGTGDFIGLLTVLGLIATVSIIVFFICRAIVLWYWKVDRIVILLEEIESHLNPESGQSAKDPGKNIEKV